MPEHQANYSAEIKPKNFVDQFYYLLNHQQLEKLFTRGELSFEADFKKLPKHIFGHLKAGDIYECRFADGELKKFKLPLWSRLLIISKLSLCA